MISAVSWAGPGDTVKIGVRYDPSTASIIKMRLGNDIPVILPMHESLLVSDPVTGNREPALAKSIEILDNGKTLRIVINKGSFFHTGNPVTAHDVKFTYEQGVNPSNGNLMAGPFDEIEEITIIDDHTLEFKFWEPYAPWKELANADFKFALNHAINRQEMVDKIFLGKGYPLYMYANTAELGYNPSIKWEFNPEKAKAFLKKSGYKKDTPLTISYASDIPNSSLVAASVQKYLREVGITIKLQQLKVGTMATWAKKQDKRYGAMGMYTWAGTRDPSLRMQLTLHSKGMYASYPNRYNKDEFDRLVTSQGREQAVPINVSLPWHPCLK